MKFKLLHVCTLFYLTLVGSHAVSDPQVYWKSVLPNSPIPKAIKDLLFTKAWDDGNENVATSTDSENIKLKDQPEQSYSYVPSKYEVNDQPPQNYLWWLHASNNQLKDDHVMKLLFLENDLHQGQEMNLHFMKNDQKPTILPKNISDSIPFSLKDLPEIYNIFSVKPDSMEAEIIQQTLDLCAHKIIEGEEIFCATSLESLIDLTTRKLGKTVKPLSTEVNAKESTMSQKYKVGLVKMLAANKVVVCHMQSYAYAVFYCHVSFDIRSYAVSLEGEDGTKVKSMAVCHTDTSKWNPKLLAFEFLNVAPGGPVCHFLPEDHVIWVPY